MNTFPRIVNTYTLLAVLVITTLSSCSWFQDSPDDMVIDVRDEFTIHAEEIFGKDQSGLRFIIQTSLPQNCRNSVINSESAISQDFIDITIHSIEEPAVCDSIRTVLYKFEEFFPLSKSSYDLNVSLRNVIDNLGSVDIFNDRIVVSIPNSSGISVSTATTYRLPENTIWGYAQSNENDFGGILVDFVTDLSIISENVALQEGLYSGFSIDQNGALDFEFIKPNMSQQTFYFKFDGATSDLIDLLATYRSNYGNKAEFVIYNTDGEVL